MEQKNFNVFLNKVWGLQQLNKLLKKLRKAGKTKQQWSTELRERTITLTVNFFETQFRKKMSNLTHSYYRLLSYSKDRLVAKYMFCQMLICVCAEILLERLTSFLSTIPQVISLSLTRTR